jgi:hypothetical protein
MDSNYVASKTRSGRPGWSVTFRHPLRRDARGKLGLKIRRGLDTSDDVRADELVDQLNQLLADRSWWSVDRRTEAVRHFDSLIVSAFFDGMEAGRVDTAQLRDSRIHMPTREEGYARALLVGTTGAGKTTLLRHLIGASHERDRFPSTSTARTTIADIEIIFGPNPFKAAITFMSEFEVRAHIDECIEAACISVIEGQSDERIASSLLTHREQRFRLSYILGDWPTEPTVNEDDFSFELSATSVSSLDEDEAVSERDRRANASRLVSYIDRIKVLANSMADQTARDFEPLEVQQTLDDRAVWLELYSDRLFESEEFSKLALDIKDDIEDRFDVLSPNELERASTGWPLLWTFESSDRDEFIKHVRWFSSNHYRQFGKLLTPLVDGIRVRGPFRPIPKILQISDQLVLIDGQGLGHTSESVSSISTAVTKRFVDADLIILVDSAQQPMQAASIAVLRAAATAGYASKLALAFTHFDQVKGDNLRTFVQKREHVIASVTNAAVGLRQLLGPAVAAALERQLETRVFLFGALDREIDAIPAGIIEEVRRLLVVLRETGEPSVPIVVSPRYSIGGLELALRDAIEGFQRPWEARLGLAYRDGISPEHWTRIRALSRRFANGWHDEYDNLRPASDLIGRLQEEISRWLETPEGWTREPADEKERMAALDPIRSAVFAALHNLIKARLGEMHRSDWATAYDRSGRGSGFKRAEDIRRIYEESAPQISSAMNPQAREFLVEVIGLIRKAVDSAGGQFNTDYVRLRALN